MKVEMNMKVVVDVGTVDGLDEAVDLATHVLRGGFKKDGVEIVWIGREGASDKMTMKEFLSNCVACGGNWTAMLASGVRALWPEEFAALPEEFSFKQIMDILRKHVDVVGPESDQEVS